MSLVGTCVTYASTVRCAAHDDACLASCAAVCSAAMRLRTVDFHAWRPDVIRHVAMCSCSSILDHTAVSSACMTLNAADRSGGASQPQPAARPDEGRVRAHPPPPPGRGRRLAGGRRPAGDAVIVQVGVVRCASLLSNQRVLGLGYCSRQAALHGGIYFPPVRLAASPDDLRAIAARTCSDRRGGAHCCLRC